MACAHRHGTNTTRPDQDTVAGSNHRNLTVGACEPAGHGIGRSRGGLTTTIHAVFDGRGRPLAAVVTGGHRNKRPARRGLADIRIPRLAGGRPRTRPDAVIADKAYSAGSAVAHCTPAGSGS